MSLKEFIPWLTVFLLCSLHQSPVTARPNIAPSDAGTIFNDALNTESRIDEVPPPDTLQATPPPNFGDTYPIDDGNAIQIVTEVLPLSTGTHDEVSLNQVRDEDNTTEDTKTSINFAETTTVDNSTDVVKDSQLGILVTDVTTQGIPSANIDFDVSTLNIPTATVPNFEESKIFEDIPVNINEQIIKLEEEIIKNNLEMNPLLYSMPASTSTSHIPTTTSESTSSINFEQSKIMEDDHKEYDETIRLEDNLLKQLEVLEAVRNNIEEETIVNYVETTESSLKFTMEYDELTSIESIFGDTTNLGAMSSIGDSLDELENVSDIFTEPPFSVESNNGEYTDIPNVSNGEQFEQFEDDSPNTSSNTHIDTIEEFTTQSIEEKESITEGNFENMKPSREETYNATSVVENSFEEKESGYTTEQIESFIENIDVTFERIDEVTTEEIETTTASTNDADGSFNKALFSSEDNIANATEDIANSTEESIYTTDKTPQSLENQESVLDSITEDHFKYHFNIPEFSLFAGDAPTVSPLDFDDLDAVSSDFQYDEVDSDMTNIEYASEAGSGDYQVDVTTATENSEIISEEIIGNGRFDTINIIDLFGHRTSETPTTATTAATTTTTTTEDSKYSTEHFIVNFNQDETSEQIKTNFDISTGIEENIVHVDNETEKPTLTEPHFTVRDDVLYNPKSVIEVEDNILSLLPILEDELLSKLESVTEQHQTSVQHSVPVSSTEVTIIKKNITESPIVNSTTIDALNTSIEEKDNLPVTTKSKFDEAYEKQAIISTSDHSTVVEYRHSDSAEICFEGSFGYQLTADIIDKDGNEKRLDTPKYKDTFKKKCVNSKFPVLRITQNYSSIELRFLLEPGYLFVDEISAMISLEGNDYQAVSSDIDLFISLLEDSGTLRTNLHREFIRERRKPEGTSMIVTLFDVQLAAHTSNSYEKLTEGTTMMDELQDEELNGDEAQDEAIHTAVLVVTILLSAATLIIVLVLLVKIFLKYKSKKMVYILSVR